MGNSESDTESDDASAGHVATTDADTAFSRYPALKAMFDEFEHYPPILLPSKYWVELNRKNMAQLANAGFKNFKRTLARNYFTWIVNPLNKQVRFLMQQAGWRRSIAIVWRSLIAPRHDLMKRRHTIYYNMLSMLLWRYVQSTDDAGLLAGLDEPTEGNPPDVRLDGRLISQDLANSVIEYEAILHPDVDRRDITTIMELGPGYGRTAFVFLKLQPACRYILVDIPPALFVAQRYLTAVFPERTVFDFRHFDDFQAVAEEFDAASIVLLTPNQLELLPDQSVDLFINISSLHEMRMDQIEYFFAEIKRLTRRYFYFKQWKETTVPFENETIREQDYPIPAEWRKIYRAQCAVQHKFFEALYDVSDSVRQQ